MNQLGSLRLSILAAIGLTSCASASQSSTSGDSNSVVSIPPAPSASAASPDSVDPDDPGIPRIESKVGWLTEKNGNVHRATVVSCDPTIEMQACIGTERSLQCKTDADCKDAPHGKCVHQNGQIGDYCGCRYSCANDADCNNGFACVCKGLGRVSAQHSVCAEASCRTDSECASRECGLSVHNNGCSEHVSLACRTSGDKCKSDSECPGYRGQCAASSSRDGESPQWACRTAGCAIGRPLFVEGSARFANPTARRDWHDVVEIDVERLDAETRNTATNYYSSVAAMEHASVASFSRFSLQLLSLGAPSDLVAEAHRAALDEIEHARVAYSLASVFGGTSVGPDKLSHAAAPIATTIEAFVASLVEEGCVGETLGAAEAAQSASNAVDAGLSAALRKIAADEERHARLAWATLKWAMETFGQEARDAAVLAFEKACAFYAADPVEMGHAPELGILSAKNLGTVRRQVLSSVIAPCANALGISVPRSELQS